MSEPIEFLRCSFCGCSSQDPEIDFIVRSSLGKGAAVCNKCVAKLYVLMQNCYAGMMDDDRYDLD